MSLSSLIVQREIATIREIEEALARQVLYGGDFVTNLFEVSRIEEAALMPVVADSYGLSTAPIGELPKVPAEAHRLVAAEVVGERCFAPLEVSATLVIAVAEPLSPDVEQELTFALALPLEQRIAPRFRIRQALARDYGIALDKRTARLITKVVHNGPRMASTFPPPKESTPNLRGLPRPPSIAPPPPLRIEPEAPRPKIEATSTFVRESEGAPLRPLRRRRGPLTSDVAKTELEASAERDGIFDLLFEFARQFFDYTALFIVHGDIAEGRDAFGDGASREKVARVGVPLDLENILTAARAAKRSYRAKPKSEGLDPVLVSDLGRDGGTECIVFPVVVRTRVVALILGDGGPSGIDDDGVRQVEELVESAAGAFERVIVRRKLKGEAKPERGVAIAQKNAADSIPPPPTKVSAPPALDQTLTSAQRPAVEELAAPIRDLMMEPVSLHTATARQPTPAMTAPTVSSIGVEIVEAARNSERPPPPNLLQVRRPSGRPIPREEPEQAAGGKATRGSDPPHSPSGRPGPTRTKSQSLKRAEAPRLEFGRPAEPSVVSESLAPGSNERVVHSEPPRTTKDDSGAWKHHETGASLSPQVHPWGGGTPSLGAPAGGTPRRPTPAFGSVVIPSEVPPSPRAISPPPMRSAPITDMSPQPLPPMVDRSPTEPFPRRAPTPGPMPATRQSPLPGPAVRPPSTTLTSNTLASTLVAGSGPLATPAAPVAPGSEPKVEPNPTAVTPLVVVTPDQEMKPVPLSSVIASDPDATPLAPPVAEAEAQAMPMAGAVEARSPSSPPAGAEPILPLSQRKGAPPPIPGWRQRPMPASEQQVSVPAHKPPSSRSDHSRVLPSIIVDVTTEYVDLVDRVIGQGDEEAETQLLRAGGYAMPAIMAKFPGPISIDGDQLTSGTLPRVAECGPVLRLVASQRRTALPFVLTHVEGADPDSRMWATYLLTELLYPDAVESAVARVFDEDARVRRVARSAVRALAEVHPLPVVERLGEISNSQSELRRIQAMEALGEAREPLAVPALLPLLEDHLETIVTAARGALVLITQQDFGRDTERWLSWWGENRSRHRLEWLIDTLMHEQRALRASACEELRTITKEYFAYYDDLPKRERERAQARYREWWENVGRVRFSRAATRST